MPMHSQTRRARSTHPHVGGRPARARCAFTMIELLAVLTVVAILSVAAIPAISRMGNSRERAATYALGRDLTYARQRAQATATNSWVVFDTKENIYSILAENPASPGRMNAATITDPATNAPYIQRLNVNDYLGVTMETMEFSNSEVGFDRLGRPLLTAGTVMTTTATVILTGGGVVSVSASTGFVTITPP